MIKGIFSFAAPVLHAMPPEVAHEMTLRALEMGAYPRCDGASEQSLKVKLWELDFPNPVGIAAGFDKDARVPDAVLGMGCGFAEIGTVTPLAQSGNPKPRLFRLTADRAVINRLGFNNAGHAAALGRLAKRPRQGIVGVNIGANKEAADRAGDYVQGLKAFAEVASYFTVNISSPNTPGLRDLQAPAQLDELLSRVMAARAEIVAAGKPHRPIVVKIAPDIAEEDVDSICARLAAHRVDGIAVSNTTLSRPELEDSRAKEGGGLSGRPLFHRSTVMLARVHQATGGKIPLIGIGGIDSGATALAKFEAGASLVQLYSALVYDGPALIGQINRHLADTLRSRGLSKVTELTGTRAKEWAARPLA